MNREGPIVIIEDDIDDQELLEMVFKELGFPNEIVYLSDGQHALEYLMKDEVYPFMILSDINMPRLSGFELKRMLYTNESISAKCIPYLFFTTSAERNAVTNAYMLSAQGFFLKPDRFEKLVDTIGIIIRYWKECYSPNNFPIENRRQG
jgi:CheY-like chemotaxis protein